MYLFSQVFFAIITLCASACSILSYLNDDIINTFFLLFLTLFFISVYASIQMNRIQKNADEKRDAVAHNMHKIAHFIRDKYSEFHRKCIERSNEKEDLSTMIEATANIMVNLLSTILKSITGYKFTVSVQVFYKKSNPVVRLDNSNDPNQKMVVLSRCRNANPSRSGPNQKLYRVGDYTDLETIIIKGVDQFYSLNLLKNKSYKNPDDDWMIFYSSKITVPIRYKRIENIEDKNGECMDIKGVIVADSEDFPITENNKLECIVICKACADMLYNFIFALTELQRIGCSRDQNN